MAGVEWHGLVTIGGQWDYKQVSSDYDQFGNFNYGATGAALGISEDTLLTKAGQIYQQGKGLLDDVTPDYGNDPINQYFIEQGYAYYEDNYC